MAATTFQIEQLIQEADLKFFRSDDGEAWLFPFATCYVVAHLAGDGETLMFRGSELADLSDLPPREHHRALQHFMQLNDRINWGRFCGTKEITFEIGLPICDGELTAEQLERCLRITATTTQREKYPPTRLFADNEIPEPFEHLSALGCEVESDSETESEELDDGDASCDSDSEMECSSEGDDEPQPSGSVEEN